MNIESYNTAINLLELLKNFDDNLICMNSISLEIHFYFKILFFSVNKRNTIEKLFCLF